MQVAMTAARCSGGNVAMAYDVDWGENCICLESCGEGTGVWMSHDAFLFLGCWQYTFQDPGSWAVIWCGNACGCGKGIAPHVVPVEQGLPGHAVSPAGADLLAAVGCCAAKGPSSSRWKVGWLQ